MQTCGKLIRCWDNTTRPCIRPAGHKINLCNPFSETNPLDKQESIKVTVSPEPPMKLSVNRPEIFKLFDQVLSAANRQRKIA